MKKSYGIFFILISSLIFGLYAELSIAGVTPVPGTGWRELGGFFIHGISVLPPNPVLTLPSTGTNDLRVFGIGGDNELWFTESPDFGKTWGEYVHIGGKKLSSAPSCQYSDKLFTCWALDKDGLLSWIVFDTKNNIVVPWQSVIKNRSRYKSAPVVSEGLVYVKLHDGGIYYYNSMYKTWVSLGGSALGQISCTSRRLKDGSRIPTCFVIGTDGFIWRNISNEGWEKVQDPGMSPDGVNSFIYSDAGPVPLPGTHFFRVIAVRGTDSLLWVATSPDGDTKANVKWSQIAGTISSVPSCTHNLCFAILPDGQLGVIKLKYFDN